MANAKVLQMPFSKIYTLYQQKVTKKQRPIAELDTILLWLTGYDQDQLQHLLTTDLSLADFFNQAPAFNPNAHLITGMICGIRVETISDPLMQPVRYLDKLVDELAKGRPLTKILRQ
ncbi:hypothetical protein FD13_GL000375 [Levilactobacillus senmaizukei DSM 21775 = NBRC 103853]|uniref:DUF2200 domain-containing protein n=1 Tax=Levilactobacillus senmaizukei DSM 21775 = NBRC 103853 TaxID=1423803 RepID=A0A0R2DK38_9LACO|nr:DUF2200 domain-containing protein [Levilactobacillus senmaizukei]KRN02069.1 hypothetical protein FD13_GL000375 [Levilactobacillus senmaizukei DSM 21775 = NBRC 103853]